MSADLNLGAEADLDLVRAALTAAALRQPYNPLLVPVAKRGAVSRYLVAEGLAVPDGDHKRITKAGLDALLLDYAYRGV